MLDVEFFRLYNGLWARDLMPCLCHVFAVIFAIFTKVCRVFCHFLPWFSTVPRNNIMLETTLYGCRRTVHGISRWVSGLVAVGENWLVFVILFQYEPDQQTHTVHLVCSPSATDASQPVTAAPQTSQQVGLHRADVCCTYDWVTD